MYFEKRLICILKILSCSRIFILQKLNFLVFKMGRKTGERYAKLFFETYTNNNNFQHFKEFCGSSMMIEKIYGDIERQQFKIGYYNYWKKFHNKN